MLYLICAKDIRILDCLTLYHSLELLRISHRMDLERQVFFFQSPLAAKLHSVLDLLNTFATGKQGTNYAEPSLYPLTRTDNQIFLFVLMRAEANLPSTKFAFSAKSHDPFGRRYLKKYLIIDLKLPALPPNIRVTECSTVSVYSKLYLWKMILPISLQGENT